MLGDVLQVLDVIGIVRAEPSSGLLHRLFRPTTRATLGAPTAAWQDPASSRRARSGRASRPHEIAPPSRHAPRIHGSSVQERLANRRRLPCQGGRVDRLGGLHRGGPAAGTVRQPIGSGAQVRVGPTHARERRSPVVLASDEQRVIAGRDRPGNADPPLGLPFLDDRGAPGAAAFRRGGRWRSERRSRRGRSPRRGVSSRNRAGTSARTGPRSEANSGVLLGAAATARRRAGGGRRGPDRPRCRGSPTPRRATPRATTISSGAQRGRLRRDSIMDEGGEVEFGSPDATSPTSCSAQTLRRRYTHAP